MGNISTASVNPTITVVHNDEDGETADSIKIWSGYSGTNNYPVVIYSTKNTNLLSYVDTTLPNNSQRYYFIEIIQQDGQRIVTSPIWYTKDPFASIGENNFNASVLVFPNPVNDQLSISCPLSHYDIKIRDVTGRVMFEKQVNTNSFNIETSSYPSGIYFIEIFKDQQIFDREKFIKQ